MENFNFSLEVPEEWDVRESFAWGSDAYAWGRVELPEDKVGDESRILIEWRAKDSWNEGIFPIARREGHTVEETSIGGATVHIIYPDAGQTGPSPRRVIGAVFESLPGAPENAAAIPLTFQSFVFPDEALDDIVRMFKSVRYAPLPPSPPPPVAAATPGPDWTVLSGDQIENGIPSLTLMQVTVPSGSSVRIDTGYDNSIVTIQLDGLEIRGERGSVGSVMTVPDPKPGTRVWREQVSDVWGYFAQISRSDGLFDLQVFYPAMAQTAANALGGQSAAIFLAAEGVPEDRRGEVVAVLKSIRYGD